MDEIEIDQNLSKIPERNDNKVGLKVKTLLSILQRYYPSSKFQ